MGEAWDSRTKALLGDEAMRRLQESTVAIFGIGGVGSFAAEGLARAGVGHLVLIDSDCIADSNRNRQIHALVSTVGRKKTEVMRERILEINPQAVVDVIDGFFLPENAEQFFLRKYDYVLDAIDTITGKIHLVLQCKERGIPVLCSMGAGNKLDPSRFEVADIYQTSVDPIARVMRKKLREYGILKLPVVYSKELPHATSGGEYLGSVSFVPSVVGLIMAGEAVKALAGESLRNGGE